MVSLSTDKRTVVIIARGGGGRLICIPASRDMWRGNGARVSYSTSNSTGVVSFRQISPTTTTLITPAACIRFILPSIRNYESSLHFFHVPRFFSRRFGSPVVTRTRCSFSFRREHGTKPAIIYPERPVFFRGSKIETDEKPYFREHAAHRRLPIIGKPSRWTPLPNFSPTTYLLMKR